ncbi:MAG TPA: VWA domain-containing protein [Gaiellaceae bacterium]|nr:VWA domain-containing protein [Gaiellaceae bacterium]
MSFRSPLLLLTLLAVPALLAVLLVRLRRPPREAVAFTNLDVLAGLASHPPAWRRWAPAALLLLAVASAAAATARPVARFTGVARHSTVVLLIDVSGSMSARDVEPTRLDAATAAMRTFLDRIPDELDVGLVQFSTEPEVVDRPTADHELVRESLAYLFPEAGTAIGDGLAAATTLFRGPGAIVLLSDGTQNQGRLTALEGAARAKAAGVRVDTIALGTPAGRVPSGLGEFQPVPPDPPLMRAIARATGGRSFAVADAAQLAGVYGDLGGTIARRTSTREIGSWLALAAAAFLLGAVTLARRLGTALP